MDWIAFKQGFEDELQKIGEIDLSGLKAETLLNYPQPQEAPSEGYSKAKAILAKVRQIPIYTEEEKTAGSPDPSVLPQMNRLFGRKKKNEEPPQGKIEKAKSVGGHALAGAGSAKFTGDFVEQALASRKTLPHFMTKKYYEGRFPPVVKAGVMAGGAALGLAERARKERRKKKWQAGKLKASGATPFTFPSTGRASSQFLGKSGPSIRQQIPHIGLRGILPKI